MYPPLDELYVGVPIVPAKVNTLLPTVSVQLVPEPGYDEILPASKFIINPLVIADEVTAAATDISSLPILVLFNNVKFPIPLIFDRVKGIY
jgi:hypothetical protein